VLRVRFRDLEGAGPSRWGKSRDLSLGGLCLVSDGAIDVGAHLALEIHTDAQPPVLALARVLRCRSETGGFSVGLRFLWVGEEDQKNLAALAEFFRIHHDFCSRFARTGTTFRG
jgi:hypothetical protein